MHDQVLTSIIQLMGGILGTEAITADNKKIASNVLEKCLKLLEKNVDIAFNKEITKLTI